MKKLIFVDNDKDKMCEEGIRNVIQNLKNLGKLSDEYVSTLTTIEEFHTLGDKAYDILFNENNAVCSWSMFTATHHGSLQQLFRFLSTAGGYDIKNRIHIDCSGQMIKILRRDIDDRKNGVVKILKAIETNYIFTVNDDWNALERMRVDLTSDKIFITEKFDLSGLLLS